MKFLKIIKKLTIFFVVAFILLIGGLYIYAYVTPKLSIKSANQIYIYDKNNTLIYQGSGNNKWIALNDINDNLKNAVLSIEDKNFYHHNGFDYLRILKVMYLNIKNQDIIQGASTISQQYIKNLYLDFDQTWKRKIEEAVLTFRLEVHYEKDEILEGYLNTINYGQGNFGIENASNYYFNKSAKDLTLEESIMLAGIPKSPSNYNPVSNKELAIERAWVVAQAMLNNDYITEDVYNSLNFEDLEIYGKRASNNLNTLMYYQDAVYHELAKLKSVPNNLDASEGLKIYTDFDLSAQTALEKSIEKNMNDQTDLQVASIVVDPDTGNIVALVGGKDYSISQYNRATQAKRQVGSTIKPILYYGALENGMVSSSTFLSTPSTFIFSNKQTYSPINFNNKYGNKEITMAAALSYSDNIYAVKTHLFLGEDYLVNTAKRMGIKAELQAVPSLALGSCEINMIDYANAYVMLANGGYEKDVSIIKKVTDFNDNVIYEKENKDKLVLNYNYVYILNEMMTATYNSAFYNYNNPTLISVASKISRKYAMKTGSTGSDFWMIGYNQDYLTMVWNGKDDNSELQVADGRIAKNIWVETMETILKDIEPTWYEKPENVVGIPLDATTGQPTNEAKNIYIFYYVKGSEGTYSKESYVSAEIIE